MPVVMAVMFCVGAVWWFLLLLKRAGEGLIWATGAGLGAWERKRLRDDIVKGAQRRPLGREGRRG